MFKILSKKLINNFKYVYQMGPIGVLDESIIPFRGHLHFKQYSKQKTHPYEVKIFKLCAGWEYIHNFQIYSGKMFDWKRSVPEKVVLKLVNDQLDCGRTVVTDLLFFCLLSLFKIQNTNWRQLNENNKEDVLKNILLYIHTTN